MRGATDRRWETCAPKILDLDIGRQPRVRDLQSQNRESRGVRLQMFNGARGGTLELRGQCHHTEVAPVAVQHTLNEEIPSDNTCRETPSRYLPRALVMRAGSATTGM